TPARAPPSGNVFTGLVWKSSPRTSPRTSCARKRAVRAPALARRISSPARFLAPLPPLLLRRSLGGGRGAVSRCAFGGRRGRGPGLRARGRLLLLAQIEGVLLQGRGLLQELRADLRVLGHRGLHPVEQTLRDDGFPVVRLVPQRLVDLLEPLVRVLVLLLVVQERVAISLVPEELPDLVVAGGG